MKKLSLLLASLVSVFFTACETKQESTQESYGMKMPPVPVIATAPIVKDITIYIESIGILQPSLLTEIRPQINGTIKKLFITEGQWISKDSPVFEIDTKPFLLKIQEVEARLAIGQANLQTIQKKLIRVNQLITKDLVSKSEWEELESQVEVARASLELDKTHLAIVKHDLEQCLHKALSDGRIGNMDAYPGLVISPGQQDPVISISKMDPILVEFKLTEKEFSQINPHFHQIEVKSLCSDKSNKGEVSFLDNHFDSKTGQILVRAKVQNADFSLRPGQIVKAQIPVTVKHQVKLIPQKAIRYNQQGPYVYVILPDMTVMTRQISLGDEYQNDQIVLEGLESSEQIVVDGHLRLFPGVKIQLANAVADEEIK